MKIVAVEKKINEVINRLEKTKEERYPDLAAEKESRDREERNEKKALLQEQKKKEKDETRKKKEMDELKYIITSTQTIIFVFNFEEYTGIQMFETTSETCLFVPFYNLIKKFHYKWCYQHNSLSEYLLFHNSNLFNNSFHSTCLCNIFGVVSRLLDSIVDT